MTPNEVIAEYMGGVFEKREIMTVGGKRSGKWIFPDGSFPSGKWCYDDQLQFDVRMDWLYPVYVKLRKELHEFAKKQFDKSAGLRLTELERAAYKQRSAIEVALITGDIKELYNEVVKGIEFLNGLKK